jgi:hypothetical protein
VEKPITAHIPACRVNPATTSAFELYSPPLNPGSEVIASIRALV